MPEDPMPENSAQPYIPDVRLLVDVFTPMAYVLLVLGGGLLTLGATLSGGVLVGGVVFYFLAGAAVRKFAGGAQKVPYVAEGAFLLRRISVLAGALMVMWGAWFYATSAPLVKVLSAMALWGLAATPLVLVVALLRVYAVQLKKTRKAGVDITHPATLQKLASVNNIYTGKTGVLTAENMTVQVVVLPDGKPVLLKGVGFEASKRKDMWRLVAATTLANQASGEDNILQGDGVDVAFMRFARRMGIKRKDLLRHMPLKNFLPFDTQTRVEASFNKLSGNTVAAVKGAPEAVARLCGTPEADWLQEVDNLAQGGYRAIAVAGGKVKTPDRKGLESANLEFLGLVALVDPPQEEAADVISACRVAGVETRLLTGEHMSSALVLAKKLNIAARGGEVVSGEALLKHDPATVEFAKEVEGGYVFARLEPHQKQEVAEAALARGQFIAAVGNTAYDAPCMRAASVGIGIGKVLAEEATEAADVRIPDGRFKNILTAIKHSRLANANARKVLRYLLAVHLAEVVILAGFAAAGLPVPFSVGGLVWFNVLLLALLTVPFALEPAEKTLMRRRPWPAAEPLLSKAASGRVLLDGLVLSGLVIGAYFWHLEQGAQALVPAAWAAHLPLHALVVVSVVYAFVARAGESGFFRNGPWRGPWLWLAAVAVLALHFSGIARAVW